ncbi:MAG: hypothetical protein V1815_01025 [Candidatus Woesearchaeota archaeon]
MGEIAERVQKLEGLVKGLEETYRSDLECDIHILIDPNLVTNHLYLLDKDSSQVKNYLFQLRYKIGPTDIQNIGVIFPLRKTAFINNSHSLGKYPLIHKRVFKKLFDLFKKKGYSVDYSLESEYALVQYLTKIDPS